MTRDYYITTPCATGRVTVTDGVIVDVPPIWHHWRGRKMAAMNEWLIRLHGVKARVEELHPYNCTRCNQRIKPGDAVQTELPGMPQERLCPRCWGAASAARQAEADRIESNRQGCANMEEDGHPKTKRLEDAI